MIAIDDERIDEVMSKHQKKRNVQLLWEFLVRKISSSLVEGDSRSANAALKIMKRYYKPGTEVHKEFRLINALLRSTVSSAPVAMSIVSEAKIAARRCDPVALDRQTSLLIREINHTLDDPDFYDRHVPEYRMIATIQTLLKDWRSTDVDISRLAQYEDNVVNWLISEKVDDPTGQVIDESPGTCRLMMKVMMSKLNEKYNFKLTPEQKALIRAYAFSAASDDDTSIKKKLVETKENVVKLLDDYVVSTDCTPSQKEKIEKVKEKIVSESVERVDDNVVTRFMLYAKLATEVIGNGGEDV